MPRKKKSLINAAADLIAQDPSLPIPDPTPERVEQLAAIYGSPRKLKPVWFAWYVFRGAEPLAALIRAGYPAEGYPDGGVAKASELLRDPTVLALLQEFRTPLRERIKLFSRAALQVMAGGLEATYRDGTPDWNTRLKAADSLLDREGSLPRSVKGDKPIDDPSAQDDELSALLAEAAKAEKP